MPGEDCGYLRAHLHHDIFACRLPLCVSKTKAEEWFDIWRLINEQRKETYGWSFPGPNAARDSLRPAEALFRAVAERHRARARRRFLRARYLNSQDGTVEVWEDDAHHVDPPDDENIPADSQEAPRNLPPYFALPLLSLDPRLPVQYVKRLGDTLESGSRKEPRTERGKLQQDMNLGSTKDPQKECGKQQNANTEDNGIFPSNGDNFRLALVLRDVQNTTFLRTNGWPPYRGLYGCAPPGPIRA